MPLTLRILLLCSLVSSSGCRLVSRPTPAPSETSGIISKLDDAITIPKPKTVIELRGISRSLVQKSSGKLTFVSTSSIRPQFKKRLFLEVKDVGGIPRWQQKAMLEDLLSPDNAACGGASCAAVFGVKKEQVDEFLDEALEDVKKSETLKKPELRPTRIMMLGSFSKSTDGAAGAAKKGPQEVVYQLVKNLGEKNVTISAHGVNVSLDIKPSDLLRTEKIECFRDLCEATMHIPFTVNAGVPMPLNSQVKITYAHTPGEAGKFIEQKASIRGQVMPIKIHQILNVSVDFGADFEKGAKSAEKLIVKDVTCKGSVSCDLPIFSLNATVDKDGIAFSAASKVNAFNAGLAKVSREPFSVNKKINFADIPKTIQDMQKSLSLVKSGIKREHMDILWEHFADVRGGQM